MEKEKMELFLQSMTYDTKYKFLHEGKDKDEISEVAKRHGLVWPTRDLSILKGMYAYVDKENLNGCTLPKEEAEKALPTLKGKAVDFDHLRKSVVGHYLEGTIVEDQIITYAVFYKANFEEEFELITELFNEGNLKISFEAWGNKIEKGNGKYNLTEIEFAGGALLINTKPAAGEKAEVLEMAKTNSKVLEFASVMTAPKHFVKNKKDDKEIANEKKALEVARYTIYDMQFIMRLIDEVKNPSDAEDYGFHDILSIDFVGGIVKTKWVSFESEDKDGFFTVYLSPRVESGSEKIRKIIEVKKEDKKDDINKNNVSEDTRKMEELKKLQDELAVIKAAKETSDAEIASLKEKLATAEAKATEVEAKLVEATTLATSKEAALVEAQSKAEADKAEAIVKAKEEAVKLTLRKAELGEEFAKDLKDEDILDDVKFENAKLKKEVAELKAKAPVKASVNTGKKTEIVVGSKDTESEITKAQNRVTEMAFAKQNASAE